MLLDYETLKIIWWVLIGVLLTGFALTDGFDFGIGMLITSRAPVGDSSSSSFTPANSKPRTGNWKLRQLPFSQARGHLSR